MKFAAVIFGFQHGEHDDDEYEKFIKSVEDMVDLLNVKVDRETAASIQQARNILSGVEVTGPVMKSKRQKRKE